MQLTLKDAARLLGKNLRQVRYLIQTQQLPAAKVDGRWRIDKDDLPLSPGQLVANEKKLERALQKAQDVLGSPAGPGRKTYSVCKLQVFEKGRQLLATLRGDLTEDHNAYRLLFEALCQIACGCHEYHGNKKAAYFISARDQLSRTVAVLLLQDPPQEALAQSLETDVLPSLGGLIRQVERRRNG